MFQFVNNKMCSRSRTECAFQSCLNTFLLFWSFEGIERRITLAAVNVETGEYTTFDQKNTDFVDFPKAAYSSASVPGMFQPLHWEGRGTFMDGGTVYNINLTSAIQ